MPSTEIIKTIGRASFMGKKKKFSLTHVKSEVPVGHISGDVDGAFV